MSTLKCTECNKEFKAGFVDATKTVGMSGIQWSIFKPFKTFAIWPFQTSLVSVCPNCGKNTKLLVIASKTTKIITVSLILAVIVGLTLVIVFVNKTNSHNLLGSKKCESLLSWKEIQSICTSSPQENYSLQKKLIYANKFDDPNYSAGSDTLWNLNPGLIENCENNFEGENVSGIYLNVLSQSTSSPEDNGVSYSKDDVVGTNGLKLGVAQSAIFSKGNRSIFLREVAQPVGTPLLCSKEQMIKVVNLVESKID